MIGGRASIRGRTPSVQISAFERFIANIDGTPGNSWSDCDEMVDGQSYELDGLYATGDCQRIVLDDAGRVHELFVSNLQRDSYFTEPRTSRSIIDSPCPGCSVLEGGGPTTGILVERTSRNASAPYSSQRDIVPGDNGIDWLDSCELPVDTAPSFADIYEGDLWKPELRKQMSPWTRPNIYGYTFGDDVPSAQIASGWHVLDDFRYGAGVPDNRPIAFDYYEDATALSTFYVRDDSWMDMASDGIAFSGTVVVADGATLDIAAGVTVTFNGDLVVESGATLATGGLTTLAFGPSAQLQVDGSVSALETTFTEANTGQGWGGIDVLGAGDLNLSGGAIVEYAATGVTVYDGATATIAGSTLRHNTVGLDVFSDDGTTVSASTIEQNGTGIRTGVPQTAPGAPLPCFTTCRSTIELIDSFVNDNDDNGVYAISVNAGIRRTEMSDNGQSGLRVADATVNPFNDNILDGNGNGAIGLGTTHDGISVLTGGNIQMVDQNDSYGINRVVNSLGYELAIASGGTAFVGT